MPFAGFKDFDACVLSMTGRGYSDKVARKICGKLQAEHEAKKKRRKKRVTEESDVADFVGEFDFTVIEKSDHTYTLGPALIPEVEDRQGDVVSPEEIEKAAHDWMARGCPLGSMHQEVISPQDAAAVESYILRSDQEINGRVYKTGTWLVGVKWFNTELRKMIKTGKRKAYSIGGKGRATERAE
jgi:O-phosphoseryl-tRNA(Cys) synthetase